jgi:hypothetical protein
MNLEQVKNAKNNPSLSDEDFELNFKPITSGLGFHTQKISEVKPILNERTMAVNPIKVIPSQKKEMSVYQNDLSIFYNQNQSETTHPEEVVRIIEEKIIYTASKSQRIFAYIIDLLLLTSILAIVLVVMARTIGMDLLQVWTNYPDEITPLFVTLFCGFYLIYFSIFDKANHSTFGKNFFGLRVTGLDNSPLSFGSLLLRSLFSLLSFVSLGLFSFFDLQNRISGSKVIRIK